MAASPDATGTVDPKITTVIASYNDGDKLPKAIESFVTQTYESKELIIIDGGSIDETPAVIARYRPEIDYLVSEPDSGVLEAWNKALAQASGDWIHFLGADDFYYEPYVFAQVVDRIQKGNISSKIVYGNVERVDFHGHPYAIVGKRWDRQEFRLVEMPFSHQGVFHHRSLFEEYGNFDTYFEFTEYEMLLRYLKDHDAVFFDDLIITAGTDWGQTGRPQAKLKVALEYHEGRARHGIPSTDPRFIGLLIRSYVKYVLWKLVPRGAYLPALDLLRIVRFKPVHYSRIGNRRVSGRDA